MMKKILGLVLCLTLIFSMFPMFETPANAEVVNDVYESIDDVIWTPSTDYDSYANQSYDKQLYYNDGDEMYPVDYSDTGELWHADNRTNWTATTAYQAGARDSASNSTLFYTKSNNNSSKVVVSKTNYYSTRENKIDMGASYMNHSYFQNHHYETDFYVFVPHTSSDADGNHSCWHRVYYREDGIEFDGYYYTFYYYTNSEEGSGASFNDGNAGDVKGTGTSQVRLLCGYRECACVGLRIGIYVEKNGYIKNWSNTNGNAGTDGKLYTKASGNSNNYNKISTGNGSIIACPVSNSTSSSATSHTYSGTFYTRVGGKVRSLKANGTVFSDTVSEETDTLYSGKLYIKLSPTVTDPDPVKPEEPNPEGILNPDGVDDAGFKLQKALSQNEQGSYDITMQSYSTANTSKEARVEKVPTDFVVIVDQSGSMDTKDMATGYSAVNGTKTLEECATGSYFVKDGDNYYRVYATSDYLMEYHPSESKWTKQIIEDAGYDLNWFQGEDETSFSQSNQYYYKTADGVYRPIHVTATGKVGTYYIQFYYENAQGTRVDFIRPSKPVYKNVFGSDTSKYGPNSFGYGAVNAAVLTAYPNTKAYTYSTFLGVTTGMYVNYPMYTRHVGKSKLCYRDVDGIEHVVKTTSGATVAEYCDSNGNALTAASSGTSMNYNNLYQATGYESRIDALKGALNSFVKTVAAESDSKNGAGQTCPVDNRIAIVGFSSPTGYNNTEILTGENLSITNKNGKQMNAATDSDYATALVSANNGTVGEDYVNPKLTAAIEAVTANGGTQPEYGFQMAKNILQKRQEKEYTFTTGDLDGQTTQRNTIVIFFTDGQPGDYHESNQYSEANDVVAAAKDVKDLGAKVFSIGVFGESDGDPLTYSDRTASSQDATKEWPFLGGWMETYRNGGTYYCLRRQWRPNNAVGYTPTANDTIFDYMSVTSSNYPDAKNYIAPAWLSGGFSGDYVAATDGNAVRNKSTALDTNQFYRMAGNQDTLISAFKQSVSYASVQQINSGVVNLNSTSIFRDTINTDDFDVSNATYSVTWQPITVDKTLIETTGSAIGDLENDPNYPIVTPVVNQPVPENGVIEYRGFDYSANYVSWGKVKGYKLVVTVNGIVPTTYNHTIKSNADNPDKDYYACGIYELGKTKPAYSVESPTLYLELHEPENRDVYLKKDLSSPADDGSYTVTLQGYAKGNSSKTNAPLDQSTYLQDVIDMDNLALRSDLSEPIIHVYTLKGTADDSQKVTFEDDSNKVDITDRVEINYDDATGTVKVAGFDYNANYIGNPKPMNPKEGTGRNEGKMIIVTIGGLVPTHAGENLTSNDSAGVYDKNDDLLQDADSPTFTVGSDNSAKTYLIDFSAPLTVATEATTMTQTQSNNGTFSLIGTDVIYQLNGSPSSGNLILGNVDKAFVHGKLAQVENAKKDWCTITTVPASSVYFDDDFVSMEEPLNVGDGSGYNVGVSVSPAENEKAKGTYTFTFKGTGIDIYCTTFKMSSGGYVQGKLDDDNSKTVTMRNYSETERYNVPTISFQNLAYGEHTVELNVLGSSHYLLDGIRVYGAIDDQQQYADTSEEYAAYINMREALVNNTENTTFTDSMDDETIGALFIDDSSKLSVQRQKVDTKTGEPMVDEKGNPIMENAYESTFEAYKNNSPKNEIYLNNNEAITFQLTDAGANAAANGNLWIGLSAPDGGKNQGTVTLKEGKNINVTSGVDMYYPITAEMLGDENSVTITNIGANMISVTNLKITGNETIYNVAKPQSTNVETAALASRDEVMPLLFAPVTMRTVKLAANNGINPETEVTEPEPEPVPTVTPDPEPTVIPEPTPAVTPSPNTHQNITHVVSSIIKSILKSLSRLFGR